MSTGRLRRSRWFLAWRLAGTAVALLAAACEQRLVLPVVINQRPTVELTHAPASTTTPYTYVYEISWSGYDADGRIDYYEYVVDPPTAAGADTLWVRTTETHRTFLFSARWPDSTGTALVPRTFHVFAIRAVDEHGLASAPVVRAFFAATVAPMVQITSPLPNALVVRNVGANFRVTWTGSDPDGPGAARPLYYKYRVFGEHSLEFGLAASNPDSLRKLYEPAFAGWDSTGGDTTDAILRDLPLGSPVAFVLVAFDEAGAYSAVWSRNENVLVMQYSIVAALGPRLHLWNSYFDYTYLAGGYSTDVLQEILVDVPVGRAIPVSWIGIPESGGFVSAYRWALDIASLDDETPRTDEVTDLAHWSQWAQSATSAHLPPFDGPNGEEHRLYVEAEDDRGLRSLGIVVLRSVRPPFTKPLLIVDDTRFAVDQRVVGTLDSVRVPGGNWPSAAELDTFLYARGGVRWRSYPNGALSKPGVFAGYDYDTLGTRTGSLAVFPIQTLANYRAVIWMCDAPPSFSRSPSDVLLPMTQLRYMSRDRGNMLSLYASMGGRVWILGGSAGSNSLIEWNDTQNDAGVQVFSNAAGELTPTRFMYDVAHWQSEFRLTTGSRADKSLEAIGSWPGSPDYALLPGALLPRVQATDPLPPLRSSSAFYLRNFNAEFLTAPNDVTDDDPTTGEPRTVLDTLYAVGGTGTYDGSPIMTLYHGSENGMALFSGFPVWFFTRPTVIQLVDFVCQNVWGLERAPVPR